MNRAARFESDEQVEGTLRVFARYVNYPPTPDLAAAISARIVAPRPAEMRRRWDVLAKAAAVGAILVLLSAAAVLVTSPGAREAVADRLGIGGVTITQVSVTPAVPATATPTPAASFSPSPIPTSTPLGATLRLGQRFHLASIRGRVPFTVVVPPALGEPDAAYLSPHDPREGGVTLLWRVQPGLPATTIPGVGLLLQQFRGTTGEELYSKELGPGTTLEGVTVAGAPGFWIAGERHALFYRDAGEEFREHPLRLAGNTLVWVQDGVTLRLESGLSRDEAIALAASLVPEVEPTPTPTPWATPFGDTPALGRRSDLATIRESVPFRVVVPAGLGAPDEAYLAPDDPPEGGVTLVWHVQSGLPPSLLAGVGLLIQQFRGYTDENYFGKGVGPGTTLEAVTINGEPGYWLAGEPHALSYTAPDGTDHQHPMRMAGNTLVWVRDGVTIRLESGLSKEEAMALAESME